MCLDQAFADGQAQARSRGVAGRVLPVQDAVELVEHARKISGRNTLTAIGHFREACRLHPENWTYKRQAWSLLPTEQSPLEVYGGDWLSDVFNPKLSR